MPPRRGLWCNSLVTFWGLGERANLAASGRSRARLARLAAPHLPGTNSMMSLAASRFRSLLLSCSLGFGVIAFLGGMSVLMTPSTALAQPEENPDDAKPAEPKGKVNPVTHTVKAMFNGLVATIVTLVILAISVGMVALVIILLLDL